MSYQFPKRVLRTGDVLDATELTDDFSRPAERVSGKLNAHNFRGDGFVTGFLSGADVDPTAFYDVSHYALSVPFDWSMPIPLHLVTTNYPDSGITGPANAYLVNNNFEWQTITDDAGNAVQATISTGTSVLWINAYAQYLWHGFFFGGNFAEFSGVPTNLLYEPRWQHLSNAMKVPCNLQFALRIDGNIVEETITGVDDPTYRSSVPLKPDRQRNVDDAGYNYTPGPRDIPGSPVSSLGPPCLPIRLGACIPVQPGEHLIELIVRRVPYVGVSASEMTYSTYDQVYIYSRQLNIVNLKVFDVDSSAPAEISVPSIPEEATLSASTLYGQRLQPTIAAYNAVESGAVERGAFTHYHIPNTLLAYNSVERGPYTPEDHRFNNLFPGHGSNTVTLDGYNGFPATGWKLITAAGNGNPVKIPNFTVTSPCKILILANMQLRNVFGNNPVTGNSASNITGYFNGIPQYNFIPCQEAQYTVFALFQLMWQYASASSTEWTSIPESLGMVNNFVWWPKYYSTTIKEPQADSAELAGLENAEIQLMAMLDFEQAPTEPINIGLFGGMAQDQSCYNFLFGSIVAIAMRR